MTDIPIYGWFDDPTQASPSYDPPHDAACPYCGASITRDDVRTHSLMFAEGYARRSYFYRTHRTCHEKDPTGCAMDDNIFGMISLDGN